MDCMFGLMDSSPFCPAQSQGLTFHTDPDGTRYWVEEVYYELEESDANALEESTNELHRLCMIAAEHIIHSDELMSRMAIPPSFWQIARDSWNQREEELAHGFYGRFDLSYNGANAPVMLEYNADTPTCLLESAAIQWFWLMDTKDPDKYDQFNSLHQKLVDGWTHAKDYFQRKSADKSNPLVHFAAVKNNEEDLRTVLYMMDSCTQAGIACKFLFIEDMGWRDSSESVPQCLHFLDQDEQEIQFMFKLYPWEFLAREKFASKLEITKTVFIEPPWKAVLSNKGLLPVLHSLFPSHPNLLPSFWTLEEALNELWTEEKMGLLRLVVKPLLSREGANICIFDVYAGEDSHEEDILQLIKCVGTKLAAEMIQILEQKELSIRIIFGEPGSYGEEGFIFQLAKEPAEFGDEKWRPIIGSWIVEGKSSGILIREDKSAITNNKSRFIPHVIRME